MKIKSSYLVCGTPRSGTNFLCSLLTSTSVVGVPQEYFWKDDIERNSKEWDTTNFKEYFDKVIEVGSTPNGVFSAKAMWGYIDDFFSKLKLLPDKFGLDGKELFEAVFPDLKFVYMWRDDYIAQAVSWAKAIQTDIWHSGDTKKPLQEPEYKFDVIDNLVKETRAHNESWKKWFRDNNIKPFEVEYRSLSQNPERTILELLIYLDIDAPDDLRIETRMEKQRDSINKKWIDKYASEKQIV